MNNLPVWGYGGVPDQFIPAWGYGGLSLVVIWTEDPECPDTIYIEIPGGITAWQEAVATSDLWIEDPEQVTAWQEAVASSLLWTETTGGFGVWAEGKPGDPVDWVEHNSGGGVLYTEDPPPPPKDWDEAPAPPNPNWAEPVMQTPSTTPTEWRER